MHLAYPSIDIVAAAMPPAHDAIGEYTYLFAEEVAKRANVRVLCPLQSDYVVPEKVTTTACQSTSRDRFGALGNALTHTTSDAVLLQYNPFGWGHRGWAPDLVQVMRQFKRQRPDVRLGVMFHETYMMNPGWKSWVMRQYQRRQFYQLIDVADISLFSIEPWTEQQRQRRPKATLVHAPVGSNLPASNQDRRTTREKLGIDEQAFVCGAFGGSHPSRMLPWIESATNAIHRDFQPDREVLFLHVGGEPINWKVQSPKVCTGRVSAQDAANAIACMDVLINPFTDGISTRRGSAIAALQQGVPVISTDGVSTDTLWRCLKHNEVLLVAPSDCTDFTIQATEYARWVASDSDFAARRAYIQQFFSHTFSWPIVSQAIIDKVMAVESAPHC